MDQLRLDIRHGLRTLRRSPGTSLAAILTLALAIGANTAVFSVVDGVLLKPLPFPDAEKLVAIWETNPRSNHKSNPVSPANFYDWATVNRSFEQIAGLVSWHPNLMGSHEPERLDGALVSWQFLHMVGVEPERGRTFTAEDDQPDTGQTVFLGHSLAKRLFGDDNPLGETLNLNNTVYTIIGVAPPDFQYPEGTEFWAPLALSSDMLHLRGGRFLRVIGRLKPEATLTQARTEMTALANRLSRDHPKSNANWGIQVVPLADQIVGEVRPLLLVLWGAVGFVLLIACANVANLLFSRAASRQTEMAVRAGMGASRSRLVRQFLMESLFIALIGGLLGTAAAYAGIPWLLTLTPESLPFLERIGLNREVFFFVLLVCIFTTIVSGLAPALRFSRPNLNLALSEGGRSGGFGSRRFHRALVVVEIALALMLLIGAGLMIKSFLRLLKVDPGYRTDNVLTAKIALPGYKYGEPNRQVAFFRELEERIEGTPGVRSVGLISFLPLSKTSMDWLFAVEGVGTPQDEKPHAQYRQVSAGYFEAMGISLSKGRVFGSLDGEGQAPVMVVNQAFVDRFLTDGDPIGRRVGFGREPAWRRVIGVVEDVRHFGPDKAADPEAYVPYLQDPWQSMSLVVRTTGDPHLLVAAVRRHVREIDPNQPIHQVRSMEDLLWASVAPRRLAMWLLTVFAVVGLVLAAVGIYGVMAYSVSLRTREIGLRMALGADSRRILREVIWQGVKLALMAVIIGCLGAVALTRYLGGLLYEVSVLDEGVFLGIPLLLLTVALLACWIPAAQAARINPQDAIRME